MTRTKVAKKTTKKNTTKRAAKRTSEAKTTLIAAERQRKLKPCRDYPELVARICLSRAS